MNKYICINPHTSANLTCQSAKPLADETVSSNANDVLFANQIICL